MRLITLNTWGGRLGKPVDDFVLKHAADTDVFCFQEVHTNGSKEASENNGERPHFFEELQNLLPGFVGMFAEQFQDTGIATFVRNACTVEEEASSLILTPEDVSHLQMSNGARYYPRIVQVIKLKEPAVTIFNFHGVPGNEKKDSPERDLQMKRLHEALDRYEGQKILMGDFNLRPDTRAISDLEKGMRNLVVESGAQTTRTSHYEKRSAMPFADYVFVTPDIRVAHFEVLPDEVSDHSPLLLEIA
jgi:endonuclease/exonuclease/phosphatase family metal-dependent hydrolase